MPQGCQYGPLDIFALVKQWMADPELSQPALLVLPQAFMVSVDRFIDSINLTAGSILAFPMCVYVWNAVATCTDWAPLDINRRGNDSACHGGGQQSCDSRRVGSYAWQATARRWTRSGPQS